MFTYIKKGFRATLQQPFPLLVLFLYRFGWGIALYKLSQSVILPLLHRYPEKTGFDEQTRLFLAEGQFILLKTNISHSYFWLLAVLLAVRMIVTPLLNAGLFFSLSNTHYNAGYRFVRGIKELGASYALLYAAQIALTVLPLWRVLPRIKSAFLTAGTYQDLAQTTLPYISFMLLYGFLLHLLFLYLQFGKVKSDSMGRSLKTSLLSLPLALGIAVFLLLAAALCSLAVLGSSILWAGFWTLVIYQAYRFVQTLFSVWGIASQHELYAVKSYGK